MTVSDDPNVEPEDVDTDPVDDTTGEPEGADQLGDAGKKALDAMKAKWQKERDGRKALADQLAALNAPKTDDTKDTPDPAELRKQAQAEARAEVLKDRALDKVEAKAAKSFADPEDARALLAAQVDDFIDGQQLDLDAIDQALEELLKKKPHLAAATARRFQGGADGGARKGSTGPAQLTDQDLKRMTPQQIEDARVKGQLNDLLGVS
jgi:hypothetical protein